MMLSFVVWVASAGDLQAIVTASVQSGDWENTTTWSCDCVPGASDTITISSGTTVKLNAAHFSGDLTVNGTLDMNSQFVTLEGTTFTNNGSIVSTITLGFGEIDFNGVSAASGTTQMIAGTGAYATGGSFAIEIHIINGTTVTTATGTSISGVRNLVITSGSTLSLPSTFVFANGNIDSEFDGTLSGLGLLQTQGSTGLSLHGNTTVVSEVVSGNTMAEGNLGSIVVDTNATCMTVGPTTVGDVTVSSGAVLDTINQFVEFQGGTFTNNGSIVDSSNKFGEIDFIGVAGATSTTQTIAGTGHYGPGGPSTIEIHIMNGTTAIAPPGTVIAGVGNLAISSGCALSLPGTLVFSDGTINTQVGSTISGSGIIRTEGSTGLSLNGDIMAGLEIAGGMAAARGKLGKITIDNGATLIADDTLITDDITISNGAAFDTANQIVQFQGTTFTNNGSVFCNTSGFGVIDFKGVGGVVTTTQNLAGVGTYDTNGLVEVHVYSDVAVTSGTMLIGLANLTIFRGATFSFFGNGSFVIAGAISNAGTMNMNGGGSGCGDATKILVRSSVMGVQRIWTGRGIFSMTDLDVEDQAGSAPITVLGGTDSGNNGNNWMIDVACPTSTPTPTATPSPLPNAAQLLNISTRLNVQTGENVLIGGFIVTGTAPKLGILRGIGPSLAGTLPNVLADPTVSLYQGNNLIRSNDNWRSDQEAEIIATGLAPANDLESALVGSWVPGGYTLILSGNNNRTGLGVVEAYDLDTSANSMLANISTRGLVESGDNILIGGFIVGPSNQGEATVLVRGIGPSLSNSGITKPLQDPRIDLVDTSGTIMYSNDDWRESQESQIIATGLPPSDDRESAILESVAPGAYTAILRSNSTSTGVALVEIYRLH